MPFWGQKNILKNFVKRLDFLSLRGYNKGARKGNTLNRNQRKKEKKMTVKRVTAKIATPKDLNAMKKELQQIAKEIREESRYSFPKAMMTRQQMEKNTATINLGYLDIATENLELVEKNEKLKDFYKKYNVTAEIEYAKNSGGYVQTQIRLYY